MSLAVNEALTFKNEEFGNIRVLEIGGNPWFVGKEVAAAMGVSSDTIKNCIRRIFPQKMQNGKTTYLNEKEVACISKEMKSNTHVVNHLTYEVSSQVKTTTTELEVQKTPQTTMSVREIASVLNVTPEAIKKHVRELFPESIKNGVETRLTSYQVTQIKKRMVPTTEVVGARTPEEEDNIICEAMAILQRKANEYKARALEAERVVTRIADGRGCYTMNQTAKALKLPYGNIKLYERLRGMQILNLDNSPKQEQVNAGNFKVVVKFVNEKVGSKAVTLTTGKGLVYLSKRLNTEIDASVLPDA